MRLSRQVRFHVPAAGLAEGMAEGMQSSGKTPFCPACMPPMCNRVGCELGMLVALC